MDSRAHALTFARGLAPDPVVRAALLSTATGPSEPYDNPYERLLLGVAPPFVRAVPTGQAWDLASDLDDLDMRLERHDGRIGAFTPGSSPLTALAHCIEHASLTVPATTPAFLVYSGLERPTDRTALLPGELEKRRYALRAILTYAE